MIEIKNVSKTYRTLGGVSVNALNGISLKLADKGMVFLLGKSGSGKSTLLNALGGLDSIDSGEIIFRGKSAKNFKRSDYDSYRNTYVGFIFQEYNILEELTVGANVALAIELQGRRATDGEVNEILSEVGLSGYGARKPGELSGGQKQRVAIARALVKKPEVIMADEPTGALDSDTGRQVFDTLKSLSKDRLVLVVSHDRDFAEHYGDRIIELADGSVISDRERIAPQTEIEGAGDSLRFENDSIYIERGYTLTEDDRLAINEYLSRMTGDGVSIKLSENVGKSDEFTPTDESRIQQSQKGDFELIKSKLPIKTAFKLGSGALKYKKFKLALTIFLSLISFTLFGLADTIAAYDSISTAASSIQDSGINYLTYSKSVKNHYSDGSYWWNSWGTYLTDEEIAKIEEDMGLSLIGVYDKELSLGYKQCIYGTKIEGKSPERVYPMGFSGICGISEDIINSHGFKLLDGSRLPVAGEPEIVITKYIYDYFSLMGYSEYDKSTGERIKVDITKSTDLIGKTLNLDFEVNGTNEFEIVGIIDTGMDISRYEPLMDDVEYNSMNVIVEVALMTELSSLQEYSYHSVAFVSPEVMKSILERNADNAVYFNGYAQMSAVHDPDKDMYVDDNLICDMGYVSAIYKLDNVKERVYWLDGEKTALSKNEVILRQSMIVGLLQSYAFSAGAEHSIPVPPSLSDRLRITVERDGTETVIKSYVDYPDLLTLAQDLYDHAVTECAAANFDDAVRYYELFLAEGADITEVSTEDIIANYVTAITELEMGLELKDGFVPDGKIDVSDRYTGLLASVYKSIVIPGEKVLSYQDYTSGDSDIIENLKVVGIIPDGIGSINYGTVVSDELYVKLSGGAANGIYSFAVGEMPKDYQSIKKNVEYSKPDDDSADVRFDIRNSVTEELSFIDELLSILGKVFLYVGIGLAIFAALMLSNFIGTSISYKKQEIGILRAIGSRASDVFRIFFAESFIIAMINFILSLAGTLTLTLMLNNLFRNELGILITFLNFGIRQIALLLGVSLLVAVVATFLPVRKIASMKPIDAIKNIK